jgi:uncharacterized membrane protein (UPF0136 family)
MISLTLTPQKQDHYFFQIIPPAILLTAHFIEQGLADKTRSGKTHHIAIGAMALTAIGLAIASPAFIIIGKLSTRGLSWVDIAFSVAAALLMGNLALRFFRKNKPLDSTVFLTMWLSTLGMQITMHLWAPSMRTSFHTIASDMKRNSLDQSMVLYPLDNYRLNFELGKMIPVVKTPEELEKLMRENPGMAVIIEKEQKDFQIPAFIEPKLEYPQRGKGLIIGVLKTN